MTRKELKQPKRRAMTSEQARNVRKRGHDDAKICLANWNVRRLSKQSPGEKGCCGFVGRYAFG